MSGESCNGFRTPLQLTALTGRSNPSLIPAHKYREKKTLPFEIHHSTPRRALLLFDKVISVNCLCIMPFFFHAILWYRPPSYFLVSDRCDSMYFHVSPCMADRPCARHSFAMLHAIRVRFEAPNGFPVLTLVVLCQLPPRIIPPGSHQVRTGTFARSLLAWAAMQLSNTAACFSACYLQQLTLINRSGDLLGFCSGAPIFCRKGDRHDLRPRLDNSSLASISHCPQFLFHGSFQNVICHH